jgi:endonuclease/exonuclease/phosphatase family metal-dependent hydrolase
MQLFVRIRAIVTMISRLNAEVVNPRQVWKTFYSPNLQYVVMSMSSTGFINANSVIRLRFPLVASIFLIIALFLSAAAVSDSDQLLETGNLANGNPETAPEKIKIVSYNIRWRGGDDLKEIIEQFKSDDKIGEAQILGLQEVDRNRKRTNNTNTARLIAESLRMHYAWAAPPAPAPKKGTAEEETGVAILSRYPMSDVRRIVLPHEGPGGRRRVGLGATIQIGKTAIRVYSVHAETRVSGKKRLDQFSAVIEDLESHKSKIERAVIVGDFNTWQMGAGDLTEKFFTGLKFTTPFDDGTDTWRWTFVRMQLDWMWLRGLQAVSHGVARDIGVSDHWPLWVEVKL